MGVIFETIRYWEMTEVNIRRYWNSKWRDKHMIPTRELDIFIDNVKRLLSSKLKKETT